MANILLTIHIIIAVSLVVSVLLQRSEGGLGGLGGGSVSNLMNPQSSANFVTKLTSFLAAGFILTSISLAVVTSEKNSDTSIIENDIIIKDKLEDNEPTVPLAD
tara:strand:+ start:1772 stop:2083 length:312 start_codon:yes stop_codon:yes gene_type:complete